MDIRKYASLKLFLQLICIFTRSVLCEKRVYTNDFVVHFKPQKTIHNDIHAQLLANRHGFTNHGQVVADTDVYHFQHKKVKKISKSPSLPHILKLKLSSKVKRVTQMEGYNRLKRGYKTKEKRLDNYQRLNHSYHGNDPLFHYQWYLSNTGQAGGKPGLDLNVKPAWDLGYTGKGVNVAIMDDGLDYLHPDLHNNYEGKRKKRYTKVNKKWPNRIVKYTINNYTNKVGKKATEIAIKRALSVWEKHIPLQFEEVTLYQNPDIIIKFAWGEHGDNTAFDGKGGFLAHAYYPGPDIGGDTHFDDAEPWVYNHKNPEAGNDLFLVAVHEFGHALGLGHSDQMDAIMAPVYRYHNLTNFDVSYDDIKGIRAIYGSNHGRNPNPPHHWTKWPKTTTTTKAKTKKTLPPKTYKPTVKTTTIYTTTTTTTRKTTTKKPPKPELCQLTSYDAVSFIRRELMVFKDNYMWRKKKNKPFDYGAKINRFFKEVQKVNAVYEDKEFIRLFDGFLFWKYKGTQLKRGGSNGVHVRHIGLQNDEIDAAIYLKNSGQPYLFKGEHLWELEPYSKVNNNIHSKKDFPKKRSKKSEFKWAPKKIDAAFTSLDGKLTYFVFGTKYWMYDNEKMERIFGEKDFRKDFLGCDDIRKNTESRLENENPSQTLPGIIAVSTCSAITLLSAMLYIIYRKRSIRSNPMMIKSSVLSPGSHRQNFKQGWSKHHNLKNSDEERIMCVTAARQKWRLMRFNLQGQV